MTFSIIFLSCLLIGAHGALFSPFIIGGQDIHIREASFMLSLAERGDHICGAVSLTPNMALTAAQCVTDFSGDVKPQLSIRSGSTNRKYGGRIHFVTQVIVHPLFDEYTLANDFALVKVSTNFNIRSGVEFPTSWCGKGPSAGSTATIYGWGKTHSYGELSDTLQRAQVYIMDQEACDQYTKLPGVSMVCAKSSGVGPCTGDEGGPLMFGNVLLGVTSWRKDCMDATLPDVYSNVNDPFTRSWIDQNTRNMCSCVPNPPPL